ncbi:MAG: beta-phosphoglucomutase family hydrolase [Gammaproteobacteria bacterium]|nr:beta-phosphoglucomutase family hydrolase [Gammaproteobacteria bacterium]
MGTKYHYHAVIFDLDGVVTKTEQLHARAWKTLFDDYLTSREQRTGKAHRPFNPRDDYLDYVDGKPRLEGIESFLTSRNIELPRGSPEDSTDTETICGLGAAKNELFRKILRNQGVEVYESSIELIRKLRKNGIRVAIVSSSKNCKEILMAAGIESLFDVRVDGVLAQQLALAGKPQPDIFLESAERLGVAPMQAVVVEDAQSGVRAGRRGAFGLVIGVDRGQQREALLAAGAHQVVSDLGETSGERIDEWFQLSRD